MPVAVGQRVRNRFTGETMTFRGTSDDSAGERVEFDLELRPLGAPGGAPHHHLPVERFEFTSGAAFVWIEGQPPRLVHAGDTFEVPSQRWHYVLALGRCRARVSIRPGMRFDELLVDMAALGSGELRPTILRRVLPLLREHGCL